MSVDRIRLLEHLVRSQYGVAVGEVAALLLSRGTLDFAQLFRLSSLPAKHIKAALGVLSTHSLLYHSETETRNGSKEMYEMNEQRILERMRIGLYADLVASWMSKAVQGSSGYGMEAVVHALASEGMLKQDELVRTLSRGMRNERDVDIQHLLSGDGDDSGRNKGKGKARDSVMSESQYNVAATRLLSRALKDGIISVVTRGSQTSPSSLEIKWEAELKNAIKGIMTGKQVTELKQDLALKLETNDEFERQLAAGIEATMSSRGELKMPKKRGRTEGEEELGTPLPPYAFYRINTEKLHIRWRSELMREYILEEFNPTIAAVFGAILEIADEDVQVLTEGVSAPISSHAILARIQAHGIDLSACYAPLPKGGPNIPAGKWKVPKEPLEILHEICNDLADRRDGLQAPEAPLGQSLEFLSAVGNAGSTGMRWRVEYKNIGARMKRVLVEAMIENSLDRTAIRCWRIIEGKGKLEEKHLGTLALVPVSSARETLARLSDLNYIESQEVPRTADRAPSRTFFLWYVNYPKVIDTIIQRQYKALANLQAQRFFQLEKQKALIAKTERTDVKEAAGDLLTAADKVELEQLDGILEALGTAALRIDRNVFVLRDLDP